MMGQLNQRVSEDVERAFRTAVVEDHGKLWGHASDEMERALHLYLIIRDEGTKEGKAGEWARKLWINAGEQ